MKALGRIAGTAVLLLFPLLAPAQSPAEQPLESSIVQRKVVRSANGGETYASADQVKPGDVIEYVATYRNTTRQILTAVVPTLPIPAATEFVPGSTRPAAVVVSVDGQRYGALPLKRVVSKNGVNVEEAVPARDVRFIRWPATDLSGNQMFTVAARVRVVE